MKIPAAAMYLLLLLCCCVSKGQSFKVFLVGDAGEDAVTGTTLQNLGKQLRANPNSAVVFLGDNAYKGAIWNLFPEGFLGFDSSSLAQKKINSQLDILNHYRGYVYFVPGNHDWWNLTKLEKGLPKLKMEQSFIEASLSKNITIANPRNTFFTTKWRCRTGVRRS